MPTVGSNIPWTADDRMCKNGESELSTSVYSSSLFCCCLEVHFAFLFLFF